MADFEFDGVGSAGRGPQPSVADRAARLTQICGAAVSLALIAGLAVWGYRLAVRDVNGIPVVKALDGPMRVAPDDPGGDSPPHQGLAVNRIAAEGMAAPPPDRIVLAPRSVDLEAEDMAAAALRSVPRFAPAVAAPPVTEAPAEALEPVLPTPAADLAVPAIAALAEAGIASIAPDEQEEAPADLTMAAIEEAVAAALLAGDDIVPASVPGVARSPYPRPRPAEAPPMLIRAAFSPSAAVAGAAGALPGRTAELSPADLPPGTRLVQFGAFDSPEEARTAWQRLLERFPALMEGKSRVIEEASSGGLSFWRLRAAGFEDLSDARRFCAAFMAERADCIPVVAR